MSTAPHDTAIHPAPADRAPLPGAGARSDLVIFLDETTLDAAIALAEAAHSWRPFLARVDAVSFQRRSPARPT